MTLTNTQRREWTPAEIRSVIMHRFRESHRPIMDAHETLNVTKDAMMKWLKGDRVPRDQYLEQLIRWRAKQREWETRKGAK